MRKITTLAVSSVLMLALTTTVASPRRSTARAATTPPRHARRRQSMHGPEGDDSVMSYGGNDKITDGPGNDKISPKLSWIEKGLYGNEGSDTVHGNGGGDDDHIEGGPGKDIINGSWGNDEFYSGSDGSRDEIHCGGYDFVDVREAIGYVAPDCERVNRRRTANSTTGDTRELRT